jgi:hypothetical protein
VFLGPIVAQLATLDAIVAQWIPTMTSCFTTVDSKLYPLLSKGDSFRFCIVLRSLNLSHFKMVEAVGLKDRALRSPWMA